MNKNLEQTLQKTIEFIDIKSGNKEIEILKVLKKVNISQSFPFDKLKKYPTISCASTIHNLF